VKTKLKYKNAEIPFVGTGSVFWLMDLEIPNELKKSDYNTGNFYGVIHYWQSDKSDNDQFKTKIQELLNNQSQLENTGNPCVPELLGYTFGVVQIHDVSVKVDDVNRTNYGYRVKINEDETLYVADSYYVDSISDALEDCFDCEKVNLFTDEVLFFQSKRDANSQHKFMIDLLEKMKKILFG